MLRVTQNLRFGGSYGEEEVRYLLQNFDLGPAKRPVLWVFEVHPSYEEMCICNRGRQKARKRVRRDILPYDEDP